MNRSFAGFLLGAITVMVLALGVYSLLQNREDKNPVRAQESPKNSRPSPEENFLPGKLAGDQYRVTVMVKSAGQLTQVVISANESGADGQVVSYKNVGDKVKKGQELIECEYLKGKAVELAAILQRAKLKVLDTEGLLKNLRQKVARFDALRKAEPGAIAEVEWDDLVSSLKATEVQLKIAEQGVIVADGRSSPYHFAAQFDGQVISVSEHLKKGFVVTKHNNPLELMRIADLSHLEATIELPYVLKHRVEGFWVICHADPKREKLPGTQTSLEEREGKLYLTVGFENPDSKLKPFEAADVIVRLKK